MVGVVRYDESFGMRMKFGGLIIYAQLELNRRKRNWDFF